MTEKIPHEPHIEYESFITGPNGARFILYPVKDLHTEEDVNKSKYWLRKNRDVLSLQIRWKIIGDTTENPMKIPDYAIIKELRRKIGELESEIQELQHKLDELEKVTPDDRKEMKRDAEYLKQQEKIKKLEKEVARLRKDNENLIIKLNKK